MAFGRDVFVEFGHVEFAEEVDVQGPAFLLKRCVSCVRYGEKNDTTTTAGTRNALGLTHFVGLGRKRGVLG